MEGLPKSRLMPFQFGIMFDLVINRHQEKGQHNHPQRRHNDAVKQIHSLHVRNYNLPARQQLNRFSR